MASHSPKDILKRLLQSGSEDNILATITRDAAKIVVLTQAEYDALPTKDENTIYFTR